MDNPDFDDEDFTYDPVGNRLTSADIAGEWTYNENNELETYNGISYVYDDNGNMTEKNDNGVVTKFFYNVEDRLERVEEGSGNVIATYYYDPFGRRLWKDVSGVRTYFHYADEGLIGEYDDTGAEIKTYGWKPGSTWSTDPMFMKVGSEYYFYHNDHLGTPQKMTSINGAVVWSAKYESFGKATIEIEPVENNLRFPGQYDDVETGFHYNWNRYYDPFSGRYLRGDPIGFWGGINLYAYVHNIPINWIDPFGLCDLEDKEKQKRIDKYNKFIAKRLTEAAHCAIIYGKIEKILLTATRGVIIATIFADGHPYFDIEFSETEIPANYKPMPNKPIELDSSAIRKINKIRQKYEKFKNCQNRK